MKRIITLFLALYSSLLLAKEEEQHEHVGNSNIKINYEILDFKHSMKKENGKRIGLEIDHEDSKNHYQLYYEKSKTKTSKLIPKDLDVDKYTLKYQYKLTDKQKFTALYAHIDDNIMKETDGGKIYGLGYQKSTLAFMQYFSDYPHFDVYQSDLKYSIKKSTIKWTLLGKYIQLKNKNSNNFSKKAKSNYFTLGLKIHTHYHGYHLGASAFVGKRMFAVMKEGFKVQHHAMEFKESYVCGIGHKITKNMVAHLRYGYHKAKEVPINNDNVKVDNISFDMMYKF
jgi:hypothetical protein